MGEELYRLGEGRYSADHGYDVFVHRGVAYSKHASGSLVQGIEQFPLQPDDVLLVGHPKSGTNWLDIIIANLYDFWGTTKISRNGIVPELSLPNVPDVGFDGYETCLASMSPRLMKSHLPADHMPLAFRKNGVGKAVYIMRNPKDVCDSFYNQLRDGLTFDWNEYVHAFAEGRTVFGPWLHNVLSWHDTQLRERVLILHYENMRRDIRKELVRLVEFLGPADSNRIEQVAIDTEFQAMQQNGLSSQYQPWMKARSASVGSWKNRFTVAQSEYFDAALDTPLREAEIIISYTL